MVKIRLQRHGAIHNPIYRIVIADSRARRDGRFIEVVGLYNPKAKNNDELKLKLDRIDYWRGLGAQPTDTARSLINRYRREMPVEVSAPAEKAPAEEEVTAS